MSDVAKALAGRFLRVSVLCGLLYLLVVVVVAGLEYRSEMSKLDRGFYTDTFPPNAITQLVTLPLSLRFDDGLPSYPDQFDEQVYRQVVQVRVRAFLVAGVVQAATLGLLVAVALRLRRCIVAGPPGLARRG